ncbi:hypothetical protein SAMN05444004_102289 [Jannaschia faecimaris]|uniref:Uncharacterized protein n=1 Tax=Jannaschia faecimaris TaxID=1244108 RepID=A0A1H3LSI8_9RHOB|nr:hypothetical protein [Jannaschia faecimaris]SDY66984.1 hypothetical protein SAMN05444004_102289 [Jannaschia faecimaris]
MVRATVEGFEFITLGAQVSHKCEQAGYMGMGATCAGDRSAGIGRAGRIRPLRDPHVAGDAAELAAKLQIDGNAFFLIKVADGQSCLRAAITNRRTMRSDVLMLIGALETAVVSA